MLSNTYVRIVCANENNRIRELLERLMGEADRTAIMDEHGICLSALVERVEQERRTRRFEKYILPFIAADDSRSGFLGSMNGMKKDISTCHSSLVPVLKEAFENGTIDGGMIAPEIRRYCDLNRRLLDFEESEMGTPVKGNVAEDVWFSLAESFIKEDKELFDDKYMNEKGVFDFVRDGSARRQGGMKSEFRV